MRNWYNATDQYARQLHEVERDDYLEMKRKGERMLANQIVSSLMNNLG